MNPNTKNEILDKFTWCIKHRTIEKIIPGLDEHIPAIPQDFEKLFASKLQEVERETRASVKFELHQLNWIQCLSKAIAGRPMSFGQDPIREWRNASDQVYSSLIAEAQKEGVFPDELAQLKGETK